MIPSPIDRLAVAMADATATVRRSLDGAWQDLRDRATRQRSATRHRKAAS
jgi:hypothetical protein